MARRSLAASVKDAREARMSKYKSEPKSSNRSGIGNLLKLYNSNRYSFFDGLSLFSFVEWLFPSRRKPRR